MKITNNKIGCFSDVHLGISHDDKTWHDIILNFAKWAAETYKKHNIQEIIIPGDIFHNRNEIGVETLYTAKQFFDYFKDFKLYISTGNHDSFLKHKSDINSISIFNGWDNIHIVDQKCEILEYENKKICLVPWGVEYNDIPKSDIIFGHFEINSFYMNSFKVCEKGVDSSDLLKKSSFIVSGHFHKKDFREYKNGKILYVGSPYQQNFGDVLDERGLYIFDLQNNSFEFIKNNVSPEHFKLNLSEILNSDKLENIENNIIKLIVDQNAEPDQILNIQNKILNKTPLILKTEYQIPDKTLDGIDETFVFDENNFVKDIETYLENIDLENKKEVVEYLKELYNSIV